MAQSTKELTYTVNGATQSVELWNKAGTDIRSTYDILNDIASNWKKMTDAEKSSLAVSLAGKNQMDVFLSTLGNFTSAQRAYTTALNASGSAMKEQEAYAESLQFKLTALKAEWERLVLGGGVVDSTIKGFTDLGTAVLKFANSDLGQITIAVAGAVTALKTLQTAIEAVRQAQELKMATDIASAEANLALASTGKAIIAFGQYALVIGAVAGAIYLLYKAYKTLHPSIEDTNKKLESFRQASQNSENEAKRLEDALKGVREQISEIQAKGKLEITDENQLRLLQSQETSLRNQLILARQKAIVDKQAFVDATKAEMGKTYDIHYYTGKKQSVEDYNNYIGRYASSEQREGALKYLQEQYPSGYVPINVTETKTATEALNTLSQSLRQVQYDINTNNTEIDKWDEKLKNGDVTQEEYTEHTSGLVKQNQELVKIQNDLLNQADPLVTANNNIVEAGLDENEQAQHAIENYGAVTKELNVATNAKSKYGVETVSLEEQIEQETQSQEEYNKSLKSLSTAMKPVEKAQKEFAKNGEISASTMANLQLKASKLNVDLSDVIGEMTKTGATTEDVNRGFGEMIERIVRTSGVLDNLTEENADYIESLLEQYGIVNSVEIVQEALAKQLAETTLASKDLTDVTWDEIKALISEVSASQSASKQLFDLVQAKISANQITITTDGDIQNLIDLANAAGMASTAVANAKSAFSTGRDTSGHKMSDIEMDEAGALLNAVKTGNYTWTPITASGGTATNSGSFVYGGSNSGGTGGTGGSGGTAKDPVEEAKKQLEKIKKEYKEQLDKAVKELDYALKRGDISVEEHNDKKMILYREFFEKCKAEGIDVSEEYQEFLDDQLEWTKKRFEDTIKYEQHLIDRQIKALEKEKDSESDDYEEEIEELEEKRDKIVDALEEEIDLREEQKDAELDAIKEEQEALKKKHNEIIDAIKTQIDLLKDEKSANKEAWDEKITQLEEANDELEKQKQLEEKLEALEKAKSTRVKVFKNGRFVYDVDRDKVSEAQKNLIEYQEKLRREREKKALQDQRDAEQKNYQERIDALEAYKDQQDKYYDDLEDRLDEHYDAVDKKYTELIDALKKQKDAEKKHYDEKIKNLQKLKKETEKEYQDMIDDLNDLKDSYSDALEDMENAQNGFLDASKTFVYDYNKSLEENLQNFMTYVNGIKNGYDEIQQSAQNAQNAQSSQSSSDYNNISNYSNPAEQHDAWVSAGSPSSSSSGKSVPSGDSRGSTTSSSLADKYGGVVTKKSSTEASFPSHASGTSSIANDEIAIVGENPNREIIVGSKVNNGTLMSLSKGTGVINAKSTRTLAGLVNSIGNSNNLINRDTSVVQTFSFDKIVLPNVTNGNSFVEALSREFNNYAIQYGNIRK